MFAAVLSALPIRGQTVRDAMGERNKKSEQNAASVK